MKPRRPLIFAIDFDGVIHDCDHPVEGRHMGPPVPGTQAALRRLKQQGYKILIHSCNRPKVIRDFMTYYELPYDSIWEEQGKPVADFYVDDKAITFLSWSRFLEIVDAASV